MRLRIGSPHRVFPFFFFGHWKRSEGFREDGRIQKGLYSNRMEGFGETCTTSRSRRGVPASKNKHQRYLCGLWFYRRYPQRKRCIQLRLYGDLTELNWSRWLKFKNPSIKKYEPIFGWAMRLFSTTRLFLAEIQGLLLVLPPPQLMQTTWSGLV